ncbi:Cda4 [Cordylochernes scorpioides]|uniref:Cda4 n=1 Tax=Cordylochernes scorpioides TaxID=51811 RepID=A0ABY6L421_9ARAC|nr:Cda4 [Cordylochernes scorpioides]
MDGAGWSLGASFRCPSPNGLFAHPSNCRKFYNCYDGAGYELYCPAQLYWDDAKKSCVYRTRELICGPAPNTESRSMPEVKAEVPLCNEIQCKAPDCYCTAEGTDGPLQDDIVPQMVALTFGGALNSQTLGYYRKIFRKQRANRDSCPVRGTFFVSGEFTSYDAVHALYARGHEIGVMSLTFNDLMKLSKNESSVSLRCQNLGKSEFKTTLCVAAGATSLRRGGPRPTRPSGPESCQGCGTNMARLANISRSDIVGARAPYLVPGGDNMLMALRRAGFLYDSSYISPTVDDAVWPYTFDYRMPHRCLARTCPKRSVPGLWEVPLHPLFWEQTLTGGQCYLADQCILPGDEELILDFLVENFERHYYNNRAPFLLNFHISWLTDPARTAALDKFIDRALGNYTDTVFVTLRQAVEWMRRPKSMYDNQVALSSPHQLLHLRQDMPLPRPYW